jgi:homoserine kinase
METAQAAAQVATSPTPASAAELGSSAASAAAAVQEGSEKTDLQKQEELKQLGDFVRNKGA